MVSDGYVIGIDAGGSRTRVLCVGVDGRVLGAGDAAGGSPTHNDDARDHVQSAIKDAIDRAGVKARDAVGLVAGMAGLDAKSDRSWAESFVSVTGIECPRHVVNDAVVAQVGAFAGRPGIIVIGGTGSIIFAITEVEDHISNYGYSHYAGGARHLSFDAMAHILIDDDCAEDEALIHDVLQFWGVSSKEGLRDRIRDLESVDQNSVKRFYGKMAPLVTRAAEWSPLASAACWRLAHANCVGVKLLAAHFESNVVPIALEGAMIRSEALRTRIATALRESSGRHRFEAVDPKLSPVSGAALLALQRCGINIDERVVDCLAQSFQRPI